MAEITQLDGDVMKHLRDTVRENEFVEWVMVGALADGTRYIGYAPGDIRSADWLLREGSQILHDIEIPEEFPEGA